MQTTNHTKTEAADDDDVLNFDKMLPFTHYPTDYIPPSSKTIHFEERRNKHNGYNTPLSHAKFLVNEVTGKVVSNDKQLLSNIQELR